MTDHEALAAAIITSGRDPRLPDDDESRLEVVIARRLADLIVPELTNTETRPGKINAVIDADYAREVLALAAVEANLRMMIHWRSAFLTDTGTAAGNVLENTDTVQPY